jgi:hypothetical protein
MPSYAVVEKDLLSEFNLNSTTMDVKNIEKLPHPILPHPN